MKLSGEPRKVCTGAIAFVGRVKANAEPTWGVGQARVTPHVYRVRPQEAAGLTRPTSDRRIGTYEESPQ